MKKRVVVPLAEGFEEIEAVTTIDILRRAGVEVVVAGVGQKSLKGGQGICVVTDCDIMEVSADNIDMIILPGGWGGVDNLCKSSHVTMLLQKMKKEKHVAAICAAPYALHQAGVLPDEYTCYPGTEKRIGRQDGFIDTQNVVISKNVVTSRGPGTTFCFALTLVDILVGKETVLKLKEGLISPC